MISAKTAVKLAAAPLLLAAVVWVVDPARVAATFRRLDLAWVALGLLVSIASNVVSAWRWHELSRWLGLRSPLIAMVRVYFQGMTANTLLPGATLSGDMLRAGLLVRGGNPVLESGLSVVLDRFSGLWVLCLMSGAVAGAVLLALGLPPFWQGPALPVLATAGLTLAATLGLFLLPLLFFWGARHGLLPRLPARWRAQAERLLGLPEAGRQFVWQLGMSALVQVLSIGALALAGRATGLDLPVWTYAVAAAPIFIMAALPVSFGGWGTREAGAAVCLGLFGASTELAVTASLLYGIYATVQAGLGVLLTYLPGASGAATPSSQTPRQ